MQVSYLCPKCHCLSVISNVEELLYARPGEFGRYYVTAINIVCPVCQGKRRITIHYLGNTEAEERLQGKEPNWWDDNESYLEDE